MAHLLFPVKLIGEGSTDVESFPSYVHRCAYEHGVYVGQLLQYVYKNAIEGVETEYDVSLPNYLTVHEMVRPDRTTRMLVDLFGFMTKQNLNSSVLWFMNGSLGKSNNEIVKGFRWCPECFRDMLRLGQMPYFKLIWHMKNVKVCHIHRTPLITKCEFCGCKQTSYKKKFHPGSCLQCGRDLSERKYKLAPSDIYNSWDDIGLDIIKLFQDMAVYSQQEMPKDGISRSLEEIHHFYWENDREAEFYRLHPKNKLLALLYGEKKIGFKVARKIAYRTGVSLFAFMNGDAAKSTEVLDKSIFCRLPEGYLEPEHKSEKDHKTIFKKMLKLIDSSKAPISWKDIASRLGVSVGYLDYRYPVLGNEVKKKYKEYRQKDHLHKIYLAQKYALRYFYDEQFSHLPQSRKQAYQFIREETGLPKFILKKAIQNAYSILYT